MLRVPKNLPSVLPALAETLPLSARCQKPVAPADNTDAHLSLLQKQWPGTETDVFHLVSSQPAITAIPGRQNTILICHLLQNQVMCRTKALGFFKLSLQSQGEVGTA